MHLTNVQKFSKEIALNYGLSASDATMIGDAACLHDIGKIMIPPKILYKPDKLSSDEFSIMKTHTTKGAILIESFFSPKEKSPFALMARDIALHHHERYDGKGYPERLKEDEISVPAQVVGIADCFDALISKRCYKPALPLKVAESMILNDKCGVFSDRLKSAFLKWASSI